MKALICGVSGQDGAYLAHFLLRKGYDVYGSSRDAQVSSFDKLARMGIKDQLKLLSIAVSDFRSVFQALTKIQPDEVYNLAGQSSVGLSFEQPVETMESITVGTLNFLEAIRYLEKRVKFYNAGSSECFGNTPELAADESTPFRPRSPYAVAKASAHWTVANYREAYDLFACTGILFNHESPLRPERFVTRKIVSAACHIAFGVDSKLRLGNLHVVRDWGWAPEYVEAMWSMLQLDHPDDFVIATGQSYSLEDFVETAFSEVGLRWRDHVIVDAELLRPADLAISKGNPEKAWQQLNWRAKNRMPEVVRMMVQAESEGLQIGTRGRS